METLNGIGLGLRYKNIDDICQDRLDVPWFEVICEDLIRKGPHYDKLLSIRKDVPMAIHSVGLNLGGVDRFDLAFLTQVRNIYKIFQPVHISDHLCWSMHAGRFHHDLLPIPRTNEALENVTARINHLQDFFQRPILIENITQYIDFKNEDYTELEFIKKIVTATGCKLLLDLTNISINHKNRNIPIANSINGIPLDAVEQIHLSGYREQENPIIDSHSREVNLEDLKILKEIWGKYGKIPAMIERDSDVPDFSVLAREVRQTKEFLNEV